MLPTIQITSRDSTHSRYGSQTELTPTLFMATRPAPGNDGDYVVCLSAVVVEHDDTKGMSSDDAWSSHPQYREAYDLSMRLHEGIAALMDRRSKLPDNTLDTIVFGFTTPIRALFSAEARQDLVDLTNYMAYGPLTKACADELAKMTKENPDMSTCQIVWPEWSVYETRFPKEAAAIEAQLAELAGAASAGDEQSSSSKANTD